MQGPVPQFRSHIAMASLIALLCSACGSYDGGTTAQNLSAGKGEVKNCDELFTQRVQPRMDFCRTCHVPGGVADVEGGRLFQLTNNESEDLANLSASWERLGRNDGGKSPILKMPSGTDDRSHTGGTPWPVGSDAYKEMDAQLLGFVDPQACQLSGLEDPTAELPLLGSARGGHLWTAFCEGKPDDAALPTDPRTLVQPGVSAGKAVAFNTYWEDCHAALPVDGQESRPETCGDYRRRYAAGEEKILRNSGGLSGSGLGIPRESFDTLWLNWGYLQRPDNFEALLTERYGLNPSPYRNPFPLPGEDPNATSGGSMQLPLGFVQPRNADGSFTGNIDISCGICHGGQIGTPEEGDGLGTIHALANANSDIDVFLRDVGYGVTALLPLNIGQTRGSNQAFGLNRVGADLINPYTWDLAPPVGLLTVPPTSAGAGDTDTPQWWNIGHRARKWWDGGYSVDSTRIMDLTSGILAAIVKGGQFSREMVAAHVDDMAVWVTAQKSPAYPRPVDTQLAEAGAVLFHTKNLWGDGLENPRPEPAAGGNGSCANCHGAYAPRFVNDPAYLADSRLEGIASHISPLAEIGTDPAYVNGVQDGSPDSASGYGSGFWSYNWYAYPEGMPGYKDPDSMNYVEATAYAVSPRPVGRCAWETEHKGYLAPPLYGVWSSAPYFHNASVPNIWEVLKPSDRKPIWRRKLTTGPWKDHGFDQTLATGYDHDKLGWKYDALNCGDNGTLPYITCSPGADDETPLLLQLIQGVEGDALWYPSILNWGTLTDDDRERRKVFNTHTYGNGNEGHDFTAVLTDQERRALIEYLKTL